MRTSFWGSTIGSLYLGELPFGYRASEASQVKTDGILCDTVGIFKCQNVNSHEAVFTQRAVSRFC